MRDGVKLWKRPRGQTFLSRQLPFGRISSAVRRKRGQPAAENSLLFIVISFFLELLASERATVCITATVPCSCMGV